MRNNNRSAASVVNQAIVELFQEGDYFPALTACVTWPLFWLYSYILKRHYQKEAKS